MLKKKGIQTSHIPLPWTRPPSHLFSLMNTFSNSGLIPSTLQGTRETDDFGTDIFDSGIGTDLDPVAYKTQGNEWYRIICG